MDKIQGSMDTFSTMQITASIEGLDAECKTLLNSKEVLVGTLVPCYQIRRKGVYMEKKETKVMSCSVS